MNEIQRAFVTRLQPFRSQGYELLPISNRTRNADRTPGGWIAKVQVVRNFDSHSDYSVPLSSGAEKTYGTESEANDAALWMGLHWLEKQAE